VLILSACSSQSNTTVTVTSSGQPAATDTPAPPAPPATATPPPPVSNCSQVSGFGSAGTASAGALFTDVVFPANSVGYVKQTFEDHSTQFQIIAVCSNGTDANSVRSLYASNLPSNGWAQTNNYPYHGNPSSSCGDPYCWNAPDGRWVSLEGVSNAGSVAVFSLRLALTPRKSGSVTIAGTYTQAFELGESSDDVWWEQIDGVHRQMTPQGNAKIANVGVTNFDNVTYNQIHGLSYGTTPINGNNDSSNKLVNGDVFAVKDNAGHYVKVHVLSYGYNIRVEWVVYTAHF
jgi:hypothetical protein